MPTQNNSSGFDLNEGLSDSIVKALNPLSKFGEKALNQYAKHVAEQGMEATTMGKPVAEVASQMADMFGMGQQQTAKAELLKQLLASNDQSPKQGENPALSILRGMATGMSENPMTSIAAMNPKRGNELSSVEQESYTLNNELKRMQLDAIKNTGAPINEEELLSGVPENEREDYVVKPVKQTIRGILTTVPIVERKKTLAAAQLNELGSLDNTRQDLGAVVDRLKQSGLQIGPNLDTRPGAISDMLGQVKGSEFASLKADIGRNFQSYRKWVTGVAAGYPELNMLAPNYPKMTDSNDVFIQKSLDVMKDIERQRNILLDHYSKGGYAVSKLKGSTQVQTQGGDSSSRYQKYLEIVGGKK